MSEIRATSQGRVAALADERDQHLGCARQAIADRTRLREALEQILTHAKNGDVACLWAPMHGGLDCNARGVLGAERCMTCIARAALVASP